MFEDKQSFQISPQELKSKLDGPKNFVLLDVREPEEFAIARIDGATLIPLAELESRINELSRDKEIVTLCHHGVRSMHALFFLRAQGFEHVRNLTGGIDAWSRQVDPTVPQY